MARELLEITIDDENYTMGHWQPDFALTMLTRLIRLAGEPLAKAIIGAKNVAKDKGGFDQEMDETDMASIAAEVLGALGTRLNEDDVKKFFRDSQEQVAYKGKPVKTLYDAHYAGRIGHLMKVTKAQLRHQFQDFLEFIPALS